jgi:hypothetical protein
MYIAKLKDDPKSVKKIFPVILERIFEIVWWREKMGWHWKGFWKLKRLSPLKMLTSPLFKETFGAFLFLFLSLTFFTAQSLEELGVLMIFENVTPIFYKNKILRK